jgi:hypothetical protein
MNATDQLTGSARFRANTLGFQFQSAILSKIVIREVHSGLYLSQGDLLTPVIENGQRFDSCAVALEAATRLKLQDVELVPISERNEWKLYQSGTGVISHLIEAVRRWGGEA